MVRRGNRDGVNVLPREQFAEVRNHHAAGVAIFFIHQLLRFRALLFRHIADGHDLCAREAEKLLVTAPKVKRTTADPAKAKESKIKL